MLANANILQKAPAAKVEAERKKLEGFEAVKAQLLEQLKKYGA